MYQELNGILRIIEVDFFIAYGIYTVFYFILLIFIRKSALFKRVDESVHKFIAFCGLFYFIIWILGLLAFLFEADAESKTVFFRRAFGRYWFGYWLQPIIWIGAALVLRFEKNNRLMLVRLILAFFLTFSLERIMIIATYVEVKTSWDIGLTYWEIVLGILFKVSMFVAFGYIYSLLESRFRGRLSDKI